MVFPEILSVGCGFEKSFLILGSFPYWVGRVFASIAMMVTVMANSIRGFPRERVIILPTRSEFRKKLGDVWWTAV